MEKGLDIADQLYDVYQTTNLNSEKKEKLTVWCRPCISEEVLNSENKPAYCFKIYLAVIESFY